MSRYGGSTDQTGESRRQKQSIEIGSSYFLTSLWGWGGRGPPVGTLRGRLWADSARSVARTIGLVACGKGYRVKR